MEEDDVDVKIKNDDGEIELRPYRANKYIKEFYDNQDKMTKELFDKNIISYDLIAEVLNLTETIVKNIIEKKIKKPEIEPRRKIEIFFNKDFYEKELGEYNDRCLGCSRRNCKQHYWTTIVVCPKYKEKKNK